eukprot:GHUV01003647.1.p1 GENE.GHUV01003647.1~~GHUV01003647.1.p1  ORF type:complete len:475 (+),score=123.32 GHUV01003647.1:322-1746(+)
MGPAPKQLRILMVSDFFYPNFGGVENHIYQLSQCLINQGHKVVVMTHAYGDCGGVRYLTNGLKVYYLYRLPIHAQSTMPTWVGAFRMLRLICVRERINLVHCHQAFSTLGAEALVQARTMGYKVVFTDHSLFGFADASSIATNKLIKAVLADVQHVICVSYTSKENTVLRACLHPAAVSVIPNAVDASEFEPAPSRPQLVPGGPVTIVALSRLVYRKGIDILALVIPEICHRHPNVNFVIGGDGPKRRLLEQMMAQEDLSSRVKLAGAIPHEKARDFLLQGHIFVNASLTEAFCMAIVEAASAGLLVVSTRVGGVPEVLPPDVMLLAEPSPEDLLDALQEALLKVPNLDPIQQHNRVQAMYNWPDVAERTTAVYNKVLSTASDHDELLPRLIRYWSIGPWAGLVFCCIVVLLHWFWLFLEWQQPAADIDPAVDWPSIQDMLQPAQQLAQQEQRTQIDRDTEVEMESSTSRSKVV